MYIGLLWASNVWKSTLFNRLIWQFRAIVTDIAWTTKDIVRHRHARTWHIFLDSPGLHTFDDELPFIERLIEQSDCILFVIDHKIWMTVKEDTIHKMILQAWKKDITTLVLNKIDHSMSFADREILISNWYQLWYEHIFAVSARHGQWIEALQHHVFGIVDDLSEEEDDMQEDENQHYWFAAMRKQFDSEYDPEASEYEYDDEYDDESDDDSDDDNVSEESNVLSQDDDMDLQSAMMMEDQDEAEQQSLLKTQAWLQKKLASNEAKELSFAIVWRPNAWKSTLMNMFAWEYVSKVQDEPGTTLDYVEFRLEHQWQEFTLYDTAWIRKKSKAHGLEAIAYAKTIKMLEYKRPAVVYLIDWKEWLSQRDKTLLQEIHSLWLPLVIAMNKIDLLDDADKQRFHEYIVDHLPFLSYVHVIDISAKSGKNIHKIFRLVQTVREQSFRYIPTSQLNKAIQKHFMTRPPRFPKNKICKIYYLTQVDVHPVCFKVFVNHRQRANFSFKRWIENVIRKEFGFAWTPILLYFIERKSSK